MTALDDYSARVSDPRVAAALARIAQSAGIDLAANPGVFDEVYRKLQTVLEHPDAPSGEAEQR